MSDDSLRIPPFGLAAVSFAALLVLTQLDRLDSAQTSAVRCFAVAIPLLIGIALIDRELQQHPKSSAWGGVRLVLMMISTIADIICFAGLYWMLVHSDTKSATMFLWSSLALFAVYGLLELVMQRAKSRPSQNTSRIP